MPLTRYRLSAILFLAVWGGLAALDAVARPGSRFPQLLMVALIALVTAWMFRAERHDRFTQRFWLGAVLLLPLALMTVVTGLMLFFAVADAKPPDRMLLLGPLQTLALGWPFVELLRRQSQMMCRPRHLCPHCSYDLRATPSPHGPLLASCPECGQ